MNNKVKYITQSGVIAAIYVVLTLPFASFSTDFMQVRVSEALTVLPFFTPAAIPGLFIGCLISNIFVSKFGMVDIVFGSLASLLAAYLSRKMPSKYLVPMPPVIINVIIVGMLIYYGTFGTIELNQTLLVMMGWLLIGQSIACYGLGMPLLLIFEKYKGKIFN